MAAKIVRAAPDIKGINAVMTSRGVRNKMQAAGRRVAKKAEDISGGLGYGARTNITSKRWVAVTTIYGETPEASDAAYENNVLVKALSASGLHMRKGE